MLLLFAYVFLGLLNDAEVVPVLCFVSLDLCSEHQMGSHPLHEREEGEGEGEGEGSFK
jgi:hypothetical protein